MRCVAKRFACSRLGASGVEHCDYDGRRALRRTASDVAIGGVLPNFISRDELIVNKRATGRLQDLANLARLERDE